MNIKNRKDLKKKYGSMTISRFLKSYRLTEEISQAEMAIKLGWSKGNLCDIENGRKSVGFDRAKLIAKVTKIPISYILEIILNEQFEKMGIECKFKVMNDKEEAA